MRRRSLALSRRGRGWGMMVAMILVVAGVARAAPLRSCVADALRQLQQPSSLAEAIAEAVEAHLQWTSSEHVLEAHATRALPGSVWPTFLDVCVAAGVPFAALTTFVSILLTVLHGARRDEASDVGGDEVVELLQVVFAALQRGDARTLAELWTWRGDA